MTSGTDSPPVTPGADSSSGEEATRLRLLADMNRQLQATFASTKEFAAYRNSQNQFQDELQSRIDLALAEFRDEVFMILRLEREQEENESKRKRQRKYFWCTVSLPLLVVLYLLVTMPLRYQHVLLFTPYLTTLTSVVWIEIAAVSFGVLALGVSAAVAGMLPAARMASILSTEHDQAVRRYQPRLQIFVEGEMRLIIPGLPEPLTKVAFMEYSSALVELALAEPISTTALTSVLRFVKGYTASALGLAGPRGAGKTTILNFLTSMDRTLGVYIPAPVRYEPNELLKRIFEELANKYLGEGWAYSTVNNRSRRRSVALQLLLTAYLIIGGLAGGIALYVTHPQLVMNQARWIGILAILSSLALMAFWVKRAIDYSHARIDRDREDSAAARAESILRNFRWQQQQTSNMALETKPWGGLLRVTSEKSATATERDIGRPRLVADFQDFIRMIGESSRFDRIIIAIDELDKLASTDDLVAVINEIKDILHIEGTHVIVSVSHDALYRFMLRGLPSRDVFDSTFDEIIQVPMLDASESIEILQKRAVGFPANWGLACYILSGGLPRDLLRYGRRCVEIYRLTDEGIASVPARLLGELAAEKVLAELHARGIASRLTPRGRDKLESALSVARQGSISAIVHLENEIDGETFSPIREWLTWVTEVMDFIQSGTSDDGSGAAASLARRGVMEVIDSSRR